MPLGDRAFCYGDGLFETLRVSQGTPLHWPQHLARLQEGMASLGFPPPIENIAMVAHELLQRNNAGEGLLRLQISRGGGSRGYLPLNDAPSPLVLQFLPPRNAPSALQVALVSQRKPSLASLPGNYKLTAALASVLARQEAQARGAAEALMLDAGGNLAGFASGNLFWWQGERIFTPALQSGALAGTTRARLIAAYPQTEQVLAPFSALREAEEVGFCNALTGLVPVVHLRPADWQWPSGPNLAQAQQRLRQHDAEALAAARREWLVS